ncbi:hypothetical protein LC087_17930 [Bacillus carboniphilus]|uniref:Uncharacterized protein n=1 Tax=Bacillus carboniphilus TaxID=86663 RepID=A0ABY9JVQ8_9BACI|nr:hypothetical protein [Bacillus carboniphilus]WLR42542.1 hypothetical protein LC087_17930 [Bacillus carboniphilus]
MRNTDPSNSASVTVRLLDESSSPEALINSDSFTVNASRTDSELYSVAFLSSFLIEVEIDLANRSEVITATAVQPTVTVFNGSSEFIQFIRLLVSSSQVLQDIDYPVTPQLNLFLPDTIDCKPKISGDVSLNGIPQSGIDVSFTADTSGVSFVPNPATTNMNGDYVTSVVVTPPKAATNTSITASATVDGQNVQSVGVTEVECEYVVYVTNFLDGNISVIDSTNVIVDTIMPFSQPNGIAINNTTKLIYVVNELDNNVAVVDAEINTITATVLGVGSRPLLVALNEITNTIYVTCQSIVFTFKMPSDPRQKKKSMIASFFIIRLMLKRLILLKSEKVAFLK